MLPTIATGNVGSALAGEYEVANSLRFDSGSSDSLSHLQSTPTNADKITFSFWVKLADTLTGGGDRTIIGERTDADNQSYLYFRNDQTLGFYQVQSNSVNFDFRSTRVFRDTSAWYHIVVLFDTAQATSTNRFKIYVNNEEITNWNANTYPSQNDNVRLNGGGETLKIGGGLSQTDCSFYLAEFVYCDGQALDPTSFGEFDQDTNIWKPIDVSGLTFGNNGFYLDFENSGSLGADVSGNGNNFTVNNLTSIDQSTDTCTNNFATINPLENYHTPHTLSEGNLKQTTASSSNYAPNISTIALTQGKWYFECKYVSRSNSDNYNLIGVKSTQVTNTNYLGQNQHDYGYYSESGKYYTNNSAVTYGDSYDQGDIIGVYLDLDNNKLYFAKNGTLQNSGTGISITDPASTPLGHYFFAVGDYGSSLVIVNDWNFGGTQSFSISSGNTDPNGYGNFEYDPSSGTFDGGSKSFYALNTKNLAEYG